MHVVNTRAGAFGTHRRVAAPPPSLLTDSAFELRAAPFVHVCPPLHPDAITTILGPGTAPDPATHTCACQPTRCVSRPNEWLGQRKFMQGKGPATSALNPAMHTRPYHPTRCVSRPDEWLGQQKFMQGKGPATSAPNPATHTRRYHPTRCFNPPDE